MLNIKHFGGLSLNGCTNAHHLVFVSVVFRKSTDGSTWSVIENRTKKSGNIREIRDFIYFHFQNGAQNGEWWWSSSEAQEVLSDSPTPISDQKLGSVGWREPNNFLRTALRLMTPKMSFLQRLFRVCHKPFVKLSFKFNFLISEYINHLSFGILYKFTLP